MRKNSLSVQFSQFSSVTQSCLPHGLYMVHGILQSRILEWVAFPFSRGLDRGGVK